MGILEITQDEAKSAHKSFYDGDFEIMPMQRITYYHFFPITLIDFITGLVGDSIPFVGAWKALISTDGHKVVITRLKRSLKGVIAEDLRQVGRKYEFKIDDIVSTEFISFNYNPKVNINLNKKIRGVTTPGVPYLIKIVIFMLNLIMLLGTIIPFFFKHRQIKVKLDDKFKNKEQFKSLLEKS